MQTTGISGRTTGPGHRLVGAVDLNWDRSTFTVFDPFPRPTRWIDRRRFKP